MNNIILIHHDYSSKPTVDELSPTECKKSVFHHFTKNKMEQKNISNTPMVLGIIGGVLGLPAAICSGACAAGISSVAQDANSASPSEVGNTFFWLGLISAVVGLVSAFQYKKDTKRWGGIMLFAGIVSGITLITFNFLSLVVCILFLIGGIIAITQPKPSVQ